MLTKLINELIESKNINRLNELLLTGEIVRIKDQLMMKEDYDLYIKHVKLGEYYDMLQGVKKVLLNSSYGATLNEFCRFHDSRLGASCTGTGRQITTMMVNTVGKCLIGDNAPKLIKTVSRNKKNEIENDYSYDSPPGLGPIASDTDSCYFVMEKRVGTDVSAGVKLANEIVTEINHNFIDFMRLAFFCGPEFDTLIKANREVVAVSGIFRAKKKYILLVADSEGKKLDTTSLKSIKTQGSDIKLSSTPVKIKKLLETTIMMILQGKPKTLIDEFIMEFRKNLSGDNKDLNVLDYATVMSINKLTENQAKWESTELTGKGHVNLAANARASINHNRALTLFDDKNTLPIISGMKIKMLWLKPNEHEFINIAFSSDLSELPSWFYKNFEVDLSLTEAKLIDQKLTNIFNTLQWEIPTHHAMKVNKLLSFE